MVDVIDLTADDDDDAVPRYNTLLSFDPGYVNIGMALMTTESDGAIVRVDRCWKVPDASERLGKKGKCIKARVHALLREETGDIEQAHLRVVIESQAVRAFSGRTKRSFWSHGKTYDFARHCKSYFEGIGVNVSFEHANTRSNHFGIKVKKHHDQKKRTLEAAREYVQQHPQTCAGITIVDDHCADAMLMGIAFALKKKKGVTPKRKKKRNMAAAMLS